MIVHPTESGCVLVTQPDYAGLARRIMEHCVSLVKHPPALVAHHAMFAYDRFREESDWTAFLLAPLHWREV